MIAWHTREVAGTAKALNTNIRKGLSGAQAATLRKKHGPNTLESRSDFTVFKSLLRQLTSPLSVVLILALIVTFILGSYSDAIVIFIALLINMFIGSIQEGKSAKVFDKLAETIKITATVLRDGQKQTINASELVPGDIVFLTGGHKVPADIRLVESNNLKINEAALTGEWRAAYKDAAKVVKHDSPLPDRVNMAFAGTVVTEGYGKGVVVSIGAGTVFGSLAESTVNIEKTKTPLHKSIFNLSNNILTIIGIAIAIIFAVGIMQGGEMGKMLLLSVAVAVAAMPEGLPAAVTVTLAVVMESVLRKGGLVKSLYAAETLGSATIILTDKTGTLTKGEMQMAQVHTNLEVRLPSEVSGDTLEILKMAVLASDAFIEEGEKGLTINGRPLEKAIVEGALLAGLRQDELFTSGFARLEFVQFEASRRYAVSLNTHDNKYRIYVTGSPEHILSHSTHYLHNGQRVPLTDEVREKFKEVQDNLSGEGKRFTAVAYKENRDGVIPQEIKDPQEGESLGFVFGGLMSFADVVREDVPESIVMAKQAGIRVIMVTGDHGETAKAVAKEVGLNSANVVLGGDFAKLADEALLLAVNNDNIFARMLPEQKLRLVSVLKEHGEIVAMTGDGVNDVPALVAANIGVAQGSGTDVAKEASDMILMTGSFSVIVEAVRQGRRAVSNLRKIIIYLLSTSTGMVVLIGGSVAAGAALPLLPAQILWANIVGGGFMSFPFAFEPVSEESMQRKPESLASGGLLSEGFGKLLAFVSLGTGGTLLLLYLSLRYMGLDIDELRTVMFVAISLDSIFLVFSFKHLHRPLSGYLKVTELISNKYLILAMAASLLILSSTLLLQPVMSLLSLTALTLVDIALLIIFALTNILVVEAAKYLFIRR